MDRIILEGDNTVAKIYRGFNKASKLQFDQTVSLMVKKRPTMPHLQNTLNCWMMQATKQ